MPRKPASKKGQKKSTSTRAKRTTRTSAKTSTRKSKARTTTDHGRTGQRIPIQLLVDYRSDGNYLFDFCRDLGSGGVFIETKSPLPQGSEVSLTFTLPDSKETLDTSGQVIWVQNPIPGRHDLTPGMGVQFTGFSKNQRELLENFVTRYHGDKMLAKKPEKESA